MTATTSPVTVPESGSSARALNLHLRQSLTKFKRLNRVQRLPVHFNDEQNSVLEEDQAQPAVERGPKETELLAFFEINKGKQGIKLEDRQLA